MKKLIKNNKKIFDRIVDASPGFMVISIITLMIVLSIYSPEWVAYLVTAYILFYATESAKVGFFSWRGLKKIQENEETDWLKNLNDKYGSELKGHYQAVIIPFVREPESILKPTLENLRDQNFPNKNTIIALAPEEAFPVGEELAIKMKKEFQKDFKELYIYPHTLVEGEMKGKAANENNAARMLYKDLTAKGIDPKNVQVTSLDSDMKPDRNYLALVTYKFFEEGADRFRRIYQPIPVNLTKAWGAIPPARIIASFGLQFFTALMQMPGRLINYSVYNASLYTIKDVNFWSPDVIPEDERFYWQAFFKYGNKVKVVPMFIPVYGDVVVGDTIWDAVKQQYSQIRRWAWGASEIKYYMYNAIMHSEISLWTRSVKAFQRYRTHLEWVMVPIIITFGNLLPLILSEEYRKTPLAYTIPAFSSRVLTIMLFLFIMLIIIDNYLAPKNLKIGQKRRPYSHM